MTMMHLKYPRKRGYFHWDELGCLARALGFEHDVFFANIPDDDPVKKQSCVHVEDLINMMDVYKYYHRALDKSYNLHSEEWNLAATKKAMQLLSQNLLTFQDLHSMRVAYQVYECIDMKGLLIEEHTLLRALKMCGRTAAPLKMMHRIKHIRDTYDEDGRVQLHEFLDLVLWCDLYDKLAIEGEMFEAAVSRDDRKLFKLDDFHQVLSPYDERLANYLNSIYLAEEWEFGREKLGSKEMCREPPIKTDGLRQQIKYQKQRYLPLYVEMNESQMRVYNAKAGYVRQRPISAPDLDMYKQTDMNTGYIERFRPHTVYTSLSQQLQRSRSRSAKSADTNADEFLRPLLGEYQRSRDTPSIITQGDKDEAENQMDDIMFELETCETKHDICLKNDKDFILPGYKEKPMSPNQTVTSHCLPTQMKRRDFHLDAESINRLTYPVSRVPPPSHAKVCDARHRGWHPVKTKKGPHFVLDSTKYSSTPKLRMLDKLQRTAATQIGSLHRKHIYRYTKPSQVEREISDSRSVTTAPSPGSSERRQAWEEIYSSRRPSTISRTSAEQTDSSDKDDSEVGAMTHNNELNNKSHAAIEHRAGKVRRAPMLENIIEEGTATPTANRNPISITLTKFMDKHNSTDANNNRLMTKNSGEANINHHETVVKNGPNLRKNSSTCKSTTFVQNSFNHQNHLNDEKTLVCDDVDFRRVALDIVNEVNQKVFDPEPVIMKSCEQKKREMKSRQRLGLRVSDKLAHKIKSCNGAL